MLESQQPPNQTFAKWCRRGLCLLLCLPISALWASPSAAQRQLSNELGWIISPTPYNVCGGYYQELPIPYVANADIADQQSNYNIAADHSQWSLSGTSSFQGHVKVIQQNREVTANAAKAERDPQTKAISTVTMTGNVRFVQPGMVILADQAVLFQHLINLEGVTYRASPDASSSPQRQAVINAKTGQVSAYRLYQLNARGTAKEAKQVAPNVYQFKHASYTACPPTSNTWRLRASTVNMNFNEGHGSARNVVLFVKGLPVFYSPYYSFPLNKWRKSGLLLPFYKYSSQDGFHVGLPMYWNMAPNYDLLFTPQFISDRGVKSDFIFRYLSSHSSGTLFYSILPNDRLFNHNRDSNIAKYSNNPNYSDRVSDLESDSDNRQAFSWKDATVLNEHWRANVDFNYVNDDYYEEDFGVYNLSPTTNQLLQQATTSYSSTAWNIQAILQQYQTLHPIDQSNISNQYKKLPQIVFNFNPPVNSANWRFTVPSNYTYFDIEQNPDKTTTLVTGNRFYSKPTLTWDFSRPSGELKAQAKVWSVADATPDRPQDHGPRDIARAIPIFDASAHLNFIRDLSIHGQKMQQTLEPELYYLLVPYVNQNELPIFDSSAQTFSYAQMFSDNRFSGYDRLGDANQLTMGLKSRLLNAAGQQQASASIADIAYFRDRDVCVGYDCSTPSDVDTQQFSPLVMSASYKLSSNWKASGNIVWTPGDSDVGTLYSSIHYQPNINHIFSLGYYDVNNDSVAGVVPSLVTDSSSIQDIRQSVASAYWGLGTHWHVMGSWNHSWSHLGGSADDPLTLDVYDTFSAGFQYDSCCWAFRLLGFRSLQGFDENYNVEYNDGVYFQIALKGLGNIGDQGLEGMLRANVPGYQDNFNRQGVIQ